MPMFHIKKTHLKMKPSPARTGRVSEVLCPRVVRNSDNTFKDVHLDLLDTGKELRFVDGIWLQNHPASSNTTELKVDDLLKMRGKMDRLEQENNLLQVKVDILTDLLTEKICEEEDRERNRNPDDL